MQANWIRCDKQMPLSGDQVFLYIPDAEFEVHKGCWVDVYEYWETEADAFGKKQVTHWAEFCWPEPPIEEGGDDGDN